MSTKTNQVIFLDKVLLRGKKGVAVNGAERFNIHLIKHLQQHNIDVTTYASSSWTDDLNSICQNGAFKFIRLPQLFRVAWPNTAITLLLLLFSRKKYDALILGNVGRNLLPLVRVLERKKSFKKIVLLAHREPTKLFLQMLEGLKLTIVAVNEQIATGFRNAGFLDTHVYFGEIRHDFFSPSKVTQKDDDTVRLCVFGNLDPEWKGSDRAVEAFEMLPEKVKSKTELHLAGFAHELPTFAEPRIKAYPWIPEDEVPSFLENMDITIAPSRDTTIMKETFSQACVQAMLMGLPMIVSDLPILQEKIATGGGVVFHNREELVQQITTLCEDKSLRKKLGEEAKEIARNKFLWDTKHFVESFLFPRVN
jgi:glycosyltransferase involved in cell wall biosynthesis